MAGDSKINGYTSFLEMRSGRNKTSGKACPRSTFQPQVPRDLNYDRARRSAIEMHLLTTSTVDKQICKLIKLMYHESPNTKGSLSFSLEDQEKLLLNKIKCII